MKPASVMEARFRSGIFHASGADLSFVEGPANRRALVLLHGTGSRWQPFWPILAPLAEKYQVYALDLRGHGQSSHTPGAYRLENYSSDIQQFIHKQVQAPVVIYGHSLGGLVGMHLAANQPEAVRALILGDPPLFYHNTRTQDTFWHAAFIELLEFKQTHPNPGEMEAWLAQHMPGMSPERRAERVQSLVRLDAEVVRAVIADDLMAGISLSDLIRRITCPVLLLRGNPELGSALREQDVDFALQSFREIRLLEMETIGHGIIPVTQLPQVIEFIDWIEGEGS